MKWKQMWYSNFVNLNGDWEGGGVKHNNYGKRGYKAEEYKKKSSDENNSLSPK